MFDEIGILLVSTNPYESPLSRPSAAQATQNICARIGFAASLVGVFGVYFAGVSIVAVWIAFLCLPGLLFSIAGLFRPPRRLAGWGVALGVFGSLYLPTLYLSLRAYYRH